MHNGNDAGPRPFGCAISVGAAGHQGSIGQIVSRARVVLRRAVVLDAYGEKKCWKWLGRPMRGKAAVLASAAKSRSINASMSMGVKRGVSRGMKYRMFGKGPW